MPVYLSRTRCGLGSALGSFARWSAVGAASLYGGAIFVCRHCHRLAYASTREDAGNTAARRADRIGRVQNLSHFRSVACSG